MCLEDAGVQPLHFRITGDVGRQQPSPEAARAGPHGRGLPSLLIWYTLCAEMLRQKVQLIGCGLEGQLVQLFL